MIENEMGRRWLAFASYISYPFSHLKMIIVYLCTAKLEVVGGAVASELASDATAVILINLILMCWDELLYEGVVSANLYSSLKTGCARRLFYVHNGVSERRERNKIVHRESIT